MHLEPVKCFLLRAFSRSKRQNVSLEVSSSIAPNHLISPRGRSDFFMLCILSAKNLALRSILHVLKEKVFHRNFFHAFPDFPVPPPIFLSVFFPPALTSPSRVRLWGKHRGGGLLAWPFSPPRKQRKSPQKILGRGVVLLGLEQFFQVVQQLLPGFS